MWAYWLLFLVPAGIAVSPIRGDKHIQYMLWAIVGLLGILLIGLRYEVGGDWDPYLLDLQDAQRASSNLRNITNSPLYVFVNVVALRLGLGMGLGIYFVNLVCGALLMVGLTKYCQKQPMPWVALTVAIPYLVCIVGMGYTRQAVALGFLLWGLSILRVGNEFKFIGLIFLGSLFHQSLIVTLPLIFFSGKKYFWWHFLLFGILLIGGVYYLISVLELSLIYRAIIQFYLGTHSAGGAVRAYMNVLPIFLSLFFFRRIKRISPDYTIIKWMSIAALLSIPLLSVSTTFVDRFGLYLMPLQIALWPRLVAVQSTMLMRSIWVSMIFVYYGLTLFVWLNFALHQHLWVPYRMWPFTNETIYPTLFPM